MTTFSCYKNCTKCNKTHQNHYTYICTVLSFSRIQVFCLITILCLLTESVQRPMVGRGVRRIESTATPTSICRLILDALQLSLWWKYRDDLEMGRWVQHFQAPKFTKTFSSPEIHQNIFKPPNSPKLQPIINPYPNDSKVEIIDDG